MSHVVEAVEERDQVVSLARELGRAGHLEPDPIGHPGLGRQGAGAPDRGLVGVEADEA
jgi:hypothetical protein